MSRGLFIAVAIVVLLVLVIVIRCTVDAVGSAGRISGQPAGSPVSPAGTRTPSRPASGRDRYIAYLERTVHRLATRAERLERRLARERRATRHALGTSPVGGAWIERAFLCIHQHEGSWRDGGLPYFGGLQMDLAFMRAYGREYLRHYGTADNWPMSVQLAVAIRGWLERGFSPWPNTRRRCGL